MGKKNKQDKKNKQESKGSTQNPQNQFASGAAENGNNQNKNQAR